LREFLLHQGAQQLLFGTSALTLVALEIALQIVCINAIGVDLQSFDQKGERRFVITQSQWPAGHPIIPVAASDGPRPLSATALD
jgi:hypothetical protein